MVWVSQVNARMEDVQYKHRKGDHHTIEYVEDPLSRDDRSIPPIHEFDYPVDRPDNDEYSHDKHRLEHALQATVRRATGNFAWHGGRASNRPIPHETVEELCRQSTIHSDGHWLQISDPLGNRHS